MRLEISQLLARLERQRAHFRIIQIRVENKIAHPAHSITLRSLAFEVSRVLDLEVGSHECFSVVVVPRACGLQQVAKLNVVASHEVDYFHGVSDRSATGGGKNWRCLVGAYARRLGESQCGILVLQSPVDDRLLQLGVNAELLADCSETSKCVVLPDCQPKLRAGREKSVRLVHSTS